MKENWELNKVTASDHGPQLTIQTRKEKSVKLQDIVTPQTLNSIPITNGKKQSPQRQTTTQQSTIIQQQLQQQIQQQLQQQQQQQQQILQAQTWHKNKTVEPMNTPQTLGQQTYMYMNQQPITNQQKQQQRENTKDNSVGAAITCSNCATKNSPLWRRDSTPERNLLCNKCGLYYKRHHHARPLKVAKGRKPKKAMEGQKKRIQRKIVQQQQQPPMMPTYDLTKSSVMNYTLQPMMMHQVQPQMQRYGMMMNRMQTPHLPKGEPLLLNTTKAKHPKLISPAGPNITTPSAFTSMEYAPNPLLIDMSPAGIPPQPAMKAYMDQGNFGTPSMPMVMTHNWSLSGTTPNVINMGPTSFPQPHMIESLTNPHQQPPQQQ